MNQKNNLVTSCIVALLAGLIYYVTNETPVKDFIPQITEVNSHIKVKPLADNEEPSIASVIHYEFLESTSGGEKKNVTRKSHRTVKNTFSEQDGGEEHLLTRIEDGTGNDGEIVEISFDEGMDLLKDAPTVRHDKEDPILSKLRIESDRDVTGEMDMAIMPNTPNSFLREGNFVWFGDLSELAKGVGNMTFELKKSKSKKIEVNEVKTYDRIRKFKPNKIEKKSRKVISKRKSKVKNRVLKNAVSVVPVPKVTCKCSH